MRKLFVAGACLLSAVLGAGAAQSSIIVTLNSVTQVSNGYQYTYDILLQGGSGLSTAAPNPSNGQSYGTNFTIFDFAGYVANSINVVSFDSADTTGNLVASATATTPSLMKAPGETDDPNAINLNFAYSGANYSATSDITIGQVSAVSIFNDTASTTYSGIDVKNANGTAEFFTTSTAAPIAQVPEAASWAMMVIGFGAIGAGLRTRRKAPAVVHFG